MDLRSGFPYSLLQYGIIASYPSLQQNIATDVAIIGGGISGALTAWYLSQAGFDVVVVDRRHIGMGSTAASTSLLQYEIDVPLYELINKIGEKNATRSYHLCREAIHIMASLAHKLRVKDGFRTKSSFQFASFLKHQTNLQKEFSLRKKIGFRVQWLDEKDIRDRYGFRKPGGILSADGAEADAYLLTHALLQKSIGRGFVFGNTGIGILTDTIHVRAQQDVFTYGLAGVLPINTRVSLLSEVNGWKNPRNNPSPGAESRSQARLGIQFRTGSVRWDAAATAGLTHLDPRGGVVFGLTKEFRLWK